MLPEPSALPPPSSAKRASARPGWPLLLARTPLLPPSGIRDPALLKRQLQWLIGIRLVVITSLVLVYFLLTLLPEQPLALFEPRFLFVVVGAAYLASLTYIGLLSWFPQRPGVQAHAQFLGDLLLITTLVYYFGGASSPFSMLYLVVVSIAAVLLRRRAAILVANLAYLLYAGTLVGIQLGWITPPHPPDEISAWRLGYHLVTYLFGFYGVAVLTSFLARDVTLAELELHEHRQDLEALRVAYQDVVQSISSGLITTDLGGRITSVNRAGTQLLERSAGELVGRPVTETGLCPEELWRIGAAACERGESVRNEVESRSPQGERVIWGFSMTPLKDAHGSLQGFILVYQTLTEWRTLQQQLRLKDRMAAVGELAAGLAHEIGNPLAAISGSVQMLAGMSEANSQRSKLVDILVRESQRLNRTIKSFLQFARPKERSNVRFDIAHLLTEHVELLRNSAEVGPSHRIELVLEPSSAVVLADADQISQIFWNLARNALRAMPGGGELVVRGTIRGEVYSLQMADTGCGMSEEEQTRLFQPFQSFFDEGMGIGMAIVYRIVEEHGGRLHVTSVPGEGTTITAELPIAGMAAHLPASLEEAHR